MVTKERKCLNEPRLVDIEGKIKGNNELTLLKMTQIEKELKDLSDTMKEFIRSADEKYVSKIEHENNAEKIKGLESNQSKITWAIILSVLSAILTQILK